MMATNVRLCFRPVVRLLLPVFFVGQGYPAISSGGTRIDFSTVVRLSFLSISFFEGLEFADISHKLLRACFLICVNVYLSMSDYATLSIYYYVINNAGCYIALPKRSIYNHCL